MDLIIARHIVHVYTWLLSKGPCRAKPTQRAPLGNALLNLLFQNWFGIIYPCVKKTGGMALFTLLPFFFLHLRFGCQFFLYAASFFCTFPTFQMPDFFCIFLRNNEFGPKLWRLLALPTLLRLTPFRNHFTATSLPILMVLERGWTDPCEESYRQTNFGPQKLLGVAIVRMHLAIKNHVGIEQKWLFNARVQYDVLKLVPQIYKNVNMSKIVKHAQNWVVGWHRLKKLRRRFCCLNVF